MPPVRLYRSMLSDGDSPRVGDDGGRYLGVRTDPNPSADVKVDKEGFVVMEAAGVSVTPDDPLGMEDIRLPRALGGDGKDPIFSLEVTDLPDGLGYLPDRRRPTRHGFIVPTRRMLLAEYKALVHGTKEKWRKHADKDFTH